MNPKVYKRRVYLTGILVASAALVFFFKIFSLHFSDRISLEVGEHPESRRGYIRDRGGYILAQSIEFDSLYANPEEITESVETAALLASVLKISANVIAEKLERKKSFVWLARKISRETADIIRPLGIKGIYFKKEYGRVYPHGKLASNIIGFAGLDNAGLEGIEYQFDAELSGYAAGALIRSRDEFIEGHNLYLTIDRQAQYSAEIEIAKAVRESGARQGAAVVIETASGRVLALAKYPSFDPNRYYSYSEFARRNYTVIDSFEPGSTLKMFAAAAILEYNPAVAGRKFLCRGAVDIADATIKCTGVHGLLGLEDIMKHSCNSGIISAMQEVKSRDLYFLLKKAGFGKKTGAGLPGETEGLLRHPAEWSGLSKYSISIGHEISVNSLQLAAAFASIANGGEYMSPYIVEKIEDAEGRPVREFSPVSRGAVMSRASAARLISYMTKVVEASGTGRRAASRFYEVAGKTGTSKKFSREGGKYSNLVISSFAGIAPAKKPAVAVVIIIDEPADSLSGGEVAAPCFPAIVDRVLPVMGIKAGTLRPGEPFDRASYSGKISVGIMPDLGGEDLASALRTVLEINEKIPLRYAFYGNGNTVKSHKPGPGEALAPNAVIEIYMGE